MEARSRLSSGEALFSDGFGPLKVGIVGPGRVGGAVGRALALRGHDIVAVAASTPESAQAAAAALGARADSAEGVAAASGLVVIAVPDDALAAAAEAVARGCAPETWVIHTCGRFGVAPLRNCGERIAAVHPAVPVPDASGSLDGAAFGVTCDDEVWPFARWLVAELAGLPIRIPEEGRVAYHAALVMASNVTTALAGDAMGLAGREAVLPLLHAVLANLDRLPPDEALTGPVVRGDAGTVRAHLDGLPAHLREVYVAGCRRVLARAQAAGRISAEAARRVEEELAR